MLFHTSYPTASPMVTNNKTSEDQDTVDTTAAESQEKRKASAEHVKAADEDVPKTKKRKTSNCKD